MEERERTLVLEQLSDSREKLLGLVDGLTTEQWAYRQAEGRWSINECLEHVTRVENRVLGIITAKVAEGAPEPAKPEVRGKDEAVSKAVLDRSTTRQAPEPARPTGMWTDAQLLAEFGKTRQRTIDFVAATDADLRCHFHPHMALGELDCYQWLLVLSLHGSRHALQIEGVKASPAFPGKSQTTQA
jgi:uncharacterized damage-inducible protein DinB